MTASMACFVSGDALVKLSGQTLPMSQVIFVRSVFGAIWPAPLPGQDQPLILFVWRKTSSGSYLPFSAASR